MAKPKKVQCIRGDHNVFKRIFFIAYLFICHNSCTANSPPPIIEASSKTIREKPRKNSVAPTVKSVLGLSVQEGVKMAKALGIKENQINQFLKFLMQSTQVSTIQELEHSLIPFGQKLAAALEGDPALSQKPAMSDYIHEKNLAGLILYILKNQRVICGHIDQLTK